MKIGIITVYDSIVNFGSFLQAYAMCKVLEAKGHEVYFVRRMQNDKILYRFNELAKIQNRVSSNNTFKRAILSKKADFIVARECNANRKRFSCSLKDWESIKIIDPEELNKVGIQLIVCGSDEIWNKHNKDIDLNFYSCEWVKDIPKLAYAISSGNSRTSEYLVTPEFFDSVGNFCIALPRDQMTQKLIEDITNVKEPIVCDPTLLLGRDGFKLTDVGKSFGKYILVYSYYLTNIEKKCIKKYAKKNNLKIISPCIYTSIADEVIYTSALDFPSLVFNADCVYTTTFHGTIFSLMFAKKFCCFPRLPKVENILSQVNGTEYALDTNFSYNDFCSHMDKIVDRDKIDNGLNYLKETSNKILTKSIDKMEEIGYYPLGNRYKSHDKYYYGYSVRDDDKVRSMSSSGGMFYEFAQIILNEGGVVFGACYDENSQRVIHRSTEDVPIENMLRSKYVESQLGDTYKKIEYHLKKRRKVLFCGTPCQAAGLYNLRKEKWSTYKDQLYIMDFLCEGVPSKKIFNEYLHKEERRFNKKIKDVNFRSKSYGWNVHCMKINYDDGTTKIKPSFSDSYMHTFIMDLVMNRKSCYKCVFRDKKKSDITIGDFWQVCSVDNSCSDNKGVSAIFVNSEAGEKLISNIKKTTCIKELEEKYRCQMEQTLDTTPYIEKRNAFYAELINNGYDKAIKKYSTYFANRKILDKIKLLKIWIKLENKRKHMK